MPNVNHAADRLRNIHERHVPRRRAAHCGLTRTGLCGGWLVTAGAAATKKGVGMTEEPAASNDPARLELVDGVRGFALMGLFLVHSVELFELYWVHPVPDPWFDATMAVFAGKAFSLFALCFGLSFSIIMDRTRRRGVDFRGRFAWRLALLFLIGLVHGLVYRGDILQVLASAGLVLLLFDRIRDNRILLLLAFLILLQAPLAAQIVAAWDGAAWANATPLFMTDTSLAAVADASFGELVRANAVDGQLGKWSFYLATGRVAQIIGLFLIGLWLGRIGFFERPDAFVKARRILLVAAAGACGCADAGQAGAGGGDRARRRARRRRAGARLDGLGLDRAGADGRPADPFRRALLVRRPAAAEAAGAGRADDPDPLCRPVACVRADLLRFRTRLARHDQRGAGAGPRHRRLPPSDRASPALWFRHFHYGPLEWLWRSATWLRTDIPFRRRSFAAPQTA